MIYFLSLKSEINVISFLGVFVWNFFSLFLLNSYYVNGRDTSLEDFLDPEVLDTLATKTNEVLEVPEQSCTKQSFVTFKFLTFSSD